LAAKNVPLSTPSALSRLQKATINQDSEPKVNKTYPILNIALATAKFPKGTKANALDALARQYLWQHGADYKHGTGHGVGYYLSVHEYPSISPRSSDILESGMVVSIEPGFYKENDFGIRIENLYLVRDTKSGGFLEFEMLTKVPIDTNLIIDGMLSREEHEWVDKCNSA
jgi:Xaa-Pro aminopeptidase